jgi:cytochrome c oxidase assembly protein Cox11
MFQAYFGVLVCYCFRQKLDRPMKPLETIKLHMRVVYTVRALV